VTESVFMREGTCAIQVLRILRYGRAPEPGRFRTGYSLARYLSRTRFSSIKIDRSFVTQASRRPRQSIIRASSPCAELGMATTAEGWKRDRASDVRILGCTKVQGYYFGRRSPRGSRAIANRGLRATSPPLEALAPGALPR